MAKANTVEINGHTLTVDEEARNSWEMFDIVCEIGDEFDQSKMAQAFRLIELCCGVDKDEFIEICGGKRTPYQQVFENIATVFAAIVPKN